MLWKKESDQANALYTDLLDCSLVGRIYKDYEDDSDRQILLSGPSFKRSAANASVFRQEGNEYFAKKEWANATELYNKSMCFAEEGSELMGLAYANRASCFFNMKMYSKCLIDIEHAKQNNYPQEKLAKLDERKTICLAAMEKEVDRSEMFEPKLDYTPNEMFPCFADVLKIENNHQHGRHVVAKEDIDVGKTVMVDQSYFAETINQKYRRCGNCLRSAENLKPCHKCTFTMFCPRCEGNSFHDIECDVNPTYFGCLDFMSFRMVVIRSILLAMNAFDDIDQLIAAVEEMLSSDAVKIPESLSDPQSKYRAFFKLQPNPKEQVDRKLPQKIYLIHRLLMGQSKVSKIFHSEASKRFLMHLIGSHIIVIKNWIRNDRYKTGRIGNFGEEIEMFYEHRMSIPASYFNHSCAPNAYITSQNGINIAVTIRNVRSGEQLCVTYDDTIMLEKPKAERQRDLQSKFNFECKCDRCEQPQIESSSLKSNLRIKSDPIFQSINGGSRVESSYNYQDILSSKAEVIGLLKKYKKVAWCKEICLIIFYLYGLALMETESVSDGIPFTGRPFNRQID